MTLYKLLRGALALIACNLMLCTTATDIPLDLFAQLPAMQSARLSPDGTAIAFLRPIDGEPRLFIQELDDPSAKIKLVPPSKDLRVRWVEWASNERLVFAMEFFAQRYLTETVETRLLSIRRDGQDIRSIIKDSEADVTGSRLAKRKHAPAQLQDDVISWLQDDPDHILVALDGDQNGMDEVRKVNVHNGNFSQVVGNNTGIQYWTADQNGVVRFGFGWELSQLHTSLRSTADGHMEPSDSLDWIAQKWYPVGFSDDGQTVLVRGHGDSDKYQIRKLNLDTNELGETVFSDEEYDAHSLIRDRYDRPLGVRYVAHRFVDTYFDETYAKLQRSIDKALPATTNRIVSASDDLMRILVRTSSDVDAGVMLLWDRKVKRIDPISEIMPGADPNQMSATKAVSYKARDGLEISAYLTLPKSKGGKGLPTIVLPHGGPASRSTQNFRYLPQFLASRGYAVLQPNFRGSTGYGLRFKEAGDRQWGGTMQDDLTDGAKWLVEQGIADPNKMCIVGWSYGGYAAAMGAVKTPGLFKCAASINGVLNLVELKVDDKKYIGGRAWLKKIGLDGEKLKAVSPYHLSDAIKIPMLIIQARDDARVHLNQAEGMAKRLRKLKKEVRLVLIEKGGHSMRAAGSRATVLRELEQFLANNIGS